MGCMQVSSELLQQASDADLIILEGMGRGIETNLHAQFSVDSMKLGMIKHREVTLLPAQHTGSPASQIWTAVLTRIRLLLWVCVLGFKEISNQSVGICNHHLL